MGLKREENEAGLSLTAHSEEDVKGVCWSGKKCCLRSLTLTKIIILRNMYRG